MTRLLVYILLIPGLLILSSQLKAQQVRISLIDQITKEPVAFAHILVEDIDERKSIETGYLTDIEGKVTFNIERQARIVASFVGYNKLIDTIQPGEVKTIEMVPAVFKVDEVVVTAQFRPETVDKSIYNIKVLGAQQVENRAAVNLNEMLAGEINIRSTHDNALGSSITMQGLQGEHIKFLIDGVPVIGRQNGTIDLQQLNLHNIHHIEVVEGPMSVVYGSNALAGVINIITKDPDNQKFSLNADTYYESVGMYNFSLGGTYAWNSNSFSINGGRNFFDGYDPVDTTRYMQWKPKLQYDFDGTYMYRSDKTKFKLGGKYFYEEIRDKGNPLEVFNWDKAFDKYFYTTRWDARAEFNQKILKRAMVNVLTAYSKYNRKKNTFLKDLTNLEESIVPEIDKQDTTRFSNLLLRADFNNYVKSEKFKYQLGIDFNYEIGYGKRIENNEQEIGDYAAFFNLIITPVPQFSIQPGIRAIYNTKYKAPLVYSLNVKWNITEPLAVRASMAKGFRSPSLKELYLDFVDINHNIQGNPELEAETSLNINLAVSYNSKSPSTYNWGFDIGLFYNHIQNKISLVNVQGGDDLLYTYMNVDQFYTHGFDLNFNNHVYPWLKVILGLGITGKKQFIEEAAENQDYVYTTDFTTQINYWWRLTDLNFSLFYKYNGLYPELILTANSNTVISEVAPYNSLDINVSRWFWKRRINLQLGGKNLFDVKNVNRTAEVSGGVHSGGSGSTPVNWGRTFFVKLQFNFNR